MADQFLDHLCGYCEDEEHDTCWYEWDKPDLNCVCCLDTVKIIKESLDG